VAEQLRLAVRHALDRRQFGRPIGSFQAIQHKLADVYVGLTVADLATDEAWHDPSPSTCVLAKLLAGAAVDAANLHCQQVLGGIGFTWEHPFHRYLRRGRMLATMLGRRPQLASALGSEIVRSQRLPDLAPL
jgi:alkylation response protein AidB-like acyl-CoA dehydrogenase